MILFLDSISSLPEFSIIEDNKIIYSSKVLQNSTERMSDSIVAVYLDLEKKFDFQKNLKNLIINTGPGSYTALRIGIAFFSGLSLSQNIKLTGISCIDLFKYEIIDKNYAITGIYIHSGNNQRFVCLYDNINSIFHINKLEKNIFENKKKLNLKYFLYNNEMGIKDLNLNENIIFQKIDFKDLILKNLNEIISLPTKKIIKPIYISNNKILNK